MSGRVAPTVLAPDEADTINGVIVEINEDSGSVTVRPSSSGV
jgi:hypothetical protein